MESNEETELTRKVETDSESRLTALRMGVEGWKDQGKRTRGHGQQCGGCKGWEGDIRGVNGNGKNYNKKIKILNMFQKVTMILSHL